MEKYIIKGGNPLVGEVDSAGAKNAALPIISASIMTDETVLIENVPDVRDIHVLLQAMESIGAIVSKVDRHTYKINGSQISSLTIEDDYIKKIRASYYLLGAGIENDIIPSSSITIDGKRQDTRAQDNDED